MRNMLEGEVFGGVQKTCLIADTYLPFWLNDRNKNSWHEKLKCFWEVFCWEILTYTADVHDNFPFFMYYFDTKVKSGICQ